MNAEMMGIINFDFETMQPGVPKGATNPVIGGSGYKPPDRSIISQYTSRVTTPAKYFFGDKVGVYVAGGVFILGGYLIYRMLRK